MVVGCAAALLATSAIAAPAIATPAIATPAIAAPAIAAPAIAKPALATSRHAGGGARGTPRARLSTSLAQVEWVRRAAGRFVSAELQRSGSGACAVLNAPLRATRRGVSCEARWEARIARTLARPGAGERLRGLLAAIAHAPVTVDGDVAYLHLSTPLLAATPARFVWSESCWMLAG